MDTNGGTSEIDGISHEAAKENSYFKERLLRDAEGLDQKDLDELAESVPNKLESMELRHLNDGVQWLGSMLERVKAIYGMIFDKEYHVSRRTKLLAGAALIYFVLPTDVVPDFIPGIGYLDDALVLSALWKLVGGEISEYIVVKYGGDTGTTTSGAPAGTASGVAGDNPSKATGTTSAETSQNDGAGEA